MRRITSRAIFLLLLLADVFGAWVIVVVVQAVIDLRAVVYWRAVAVIVLPMLVYVGLLWLTFQLARRLGPSFASRFARPS
jgi:hypothetical protein